MCSDPTAEMTVLFATDTTNAVPSTKTTESREPLAAALATPPVSRCSVAPDISIPRRWRRSSAWREKRGGAGELVCRARTSANDADAGDLAPLLAGPVRDWAGPTESGLMSAGLGTTPLIDHETSLMLLGLMPAVAPIVRVGPFVPVRSTEWTVPVCCLPAVSV